MNTKQIARETLNAIERGSYHAADGSEVNLAPLLKQCVDETSYYEPEALERLQQQVLSRPASSPITEIEVVNETTLAACVRLAAAGETHIGALNFASARNPGGGFLSGAMAQEESLACSSGLYPSQLKHFAFYEFHRKLHTTLYSDRMIYSPRCPVIRRDDGSWLPRPVLVDFITSPAPNAGAIRQNEPENLPQLLPTLKGRAGKVLALAASQGCEVLILGAWGCGVFQNDPSQVAGVFKEYLNPQGQYWGRFRKVVFAVYDKSKAQYTIQAFQSQFMGETLA